MTASRPKYKTRSRKAAEPEQPGTALALATPSAMPGFSQFSHQDYTVQVPGKKAGETRSLTVSPLRAIMDEVQEAGEHVVTERTRQGVLYGAGLGIEKKALARIMGLDVETLERLYATELDTGVHLLMSDIQTNLYNIARDPNHSQAVRSGMFLLGKLGGKVFNEAKRLEAAQVNPTTRTIDPSTLTDDQRDALKDILLSAMRLAQPGAVIEGEYAEIEGDADDEDGDDLL